MPVSWEQIHEWAQIESAYTIASLIERQAAHLGSPSRPVICAADDIGFSDSATPPGVACDEVIATLRATAYADSDSPGDLRRAFVAAMRYLAEDISGAGGNFGSCLRVDYWMHLASVVVTANAERVRYL